MSSLTHASISPFLAKPAVVRPDLAAALWGARGRQNPSKGVASQVRFAWNSGVRKTMGTLQKQLPSEISLADFSLSEKADRSQTHITRKTHLPDMPQVDSAVVDSPLCGPGKMRPSREGPRPQGDRWACAVRVRGLRSGVRDPGCAIFSVGDWVR